MPSLKPLDFSRNLIPLLSLRFHNRDRRFGWPYCKSPITREHVLEVRVAPLVMKGSSAIGDCVNPQPWTPSSRSIPVI